MKPALWFAVTTSLLSGKVLFADEWIGLEPAPRLTLGLQLTRDQAHNSGQTLTLSKQLDDTVSVNLEYANDQLYQPEGSFDSERFYGQLAFLLEQDVNLAFSYQFQGHRAELEIDQFTLEIGYSPYPAFFSIQLVQGEAVIYTRDEVSQNPNIPDSVQSDLSATGFSLGWWFEHFSLSARHQAFDYERDISALGSRPLLQFLFKPAALVHSGLLVSEQSSISIDYPLNQRRLAGHLISTRSAVDNYETRSLQFDWTENLDDSTRLILTINRTDEQQDNWSLSLGLEWSA